MALFARSPGHTTQSVTLSSDSLISLLGVYLAAMSHLPNYVYYPQLARMSPEKLATTIWNVHLYALLEFGSFVLLHCTLRRKVCFSLLTQLAFVLESQWRMVQSKLVLWVLYIVQSSLEHFGGSLHLSCNRSLLIKAADPHSLGGLLAAHRR